MKENEPRSDEPPSELAGVVDDGIYRALASAERRRLLYLLLEAESRTVDELATLLLGWDVTATGTVGNPKDRDRTLIRLRHVHLPMLDEVGLVRYDPEERTVRIESLSPETVELIEYGLESPETRSE